MNVMLHRFLEECEDFFAEDPEQLQKIEALALRIYDWRDEDTAAREMCDLFCKIIGDRSTPFAKRISFFQQIRLEDERMRVTRN